MAKSLNDGTKNSPEQALHDALSEIGKNGAFENGKKLLILALDDTDDNYHINFIQAGMTMSQCLSLCEVSKMLFLREMEYTVFPHDVGLQ